MGITFMTSRAFNQHVSQAKRDASKGPVFITDRGRPAHVLLTMEDYQRIAEQDRSIVDLLAMPQTASLQFEPPRLGDELIRLPKLW